MDSKVNISIPDFQKELDDLLKSLQSHKNADRKMEMVVILAILVCGTLACYLYSVYKIVVSQQEFYAVANSSSFINEEEFTQQVKWPIKEW